jgi:N12 class adenine-specific DNA methylase/SAM-dependent methyltransferase
VAKLDANLAALRVLDRCRREERWATAEEQASLARWSGWGAVSQVFDETDDRHAAKREELSRLLGSEEVWAQARRTTLNAHYTSAEVVKAMWGAVTALGFEGGRVLEPGCGSGNFLGFAPPGADLVGVELDETTAGVAEHLYGAGAHIHVGGFENLARPDGSFDLVIGNVPFAKVAPFDPQHNRSGLSLHNYFLVKGLRLTRPGGLVVALTSRYTLDARNSVARREMARLADLVGALRLPAKAFAASSGTEVVVDLLVLRRRPPGVRPEGPEWTETVPVDISDLPPEVEDALVATGPLVVNQYLADHGQAVLGRLGVGRGMYREHELTVRPTGPLTEQLAGALDRLVSEAHERGAVLAPAPAPAAGEARTARVLAGEFETTHAQEASLVGAARSKEVGRYVGGRVVAYRPQNAKEFWELRRLIGLRDAARHVLAVQLRDGDGAELADAQQVLTERYKTYRRYYGPLNRFRMVRTGHRDPETGSRVMRRDAPVMGGFRKLDPDWPLVAALELFDDHTQAAEPAAIFTERVVAPPAPRGRAESAADAVAICLDESGMVTTERVAELLGVSEDQARAEMGTLVFDDPVTAMLVPAAEYLSGDVRRKLDAACAAVASTDGGGSCWAANVAALERVLPRQLEPGEITARLGASWIAAEDVEAFCREVLEASIAVAHLRDLGRWQVKLRAGDSRSVALSSEWGTRRASAVNLLDSALNQRLHTVYDATEDKRRVRNDAETLAARDKQEALGDRFSAWVWEDPARARRLAGTYNELFRSTVLSQHDGSRLSLPGLAATFTPRAHQRDAVARVLTDGRALLAHAVGAGKTATMVMAAMELRRLGSAVKPAVVVPNHMLEQFSREWLQLYPTARILVADAAQLDKGRRKDFVARCALGDWDGIVFTHSGFEHIPLGRGLLSEYLGEELDAARRALVQAKKEKGISVKKLEGLIAQAEQTYKKLLAAHTKDDGVRFEETGIDFVFVDEAHLFKNRRIATSIDGVATKGSRRAQDLDAKLWALRRLHGPRTVAFATATPVSNSMAELWVMQSYLQPDVLDAAGVRVFDSWAATFGRTHTALELAPDGASYRMKTRFARFQNVPELLGLYHQVADVRTAEDLGLPTPELAGGKAETVVVPPSDTLRRYVTELADRAQAVQTGQVESDEDNMLKVTGDGRRAALDLRLVGEDPDPAGGKIAAAARRIAATYEATRDRAYRDARGEPAHRPGALQLVFCDVSTPAAEGWNAYDELRHELARRGVPGDAVRYMQDAKTHQAKASLFAACRDGQVAVLIGSTETMGVGTNVQARLVALHHLDVPWRPADIEQRDGRGLRQGNQNPSIEIVRYVTEGSFDTYMWQTLERKATFISQVSAGNLAEREIDDLGEQVLSFAEIKALATGDPRIMEKAGVDSDIARLARLERAHHDDQQRLRTLRATAEDRAVTLVARADRVAAVVERTTITSGDRFAMTVDGRRHIKRADAGEHLRGVLAARLAATAPETNVEHPAVAQLAGLDVDAHTITVIENEVRVLVPDTEIDLRFVEDEWRTVDSAMLVHRLERRIQRLPDVAASLRADAQAATEEATRADALLGKPWDHTDRLARLRRRQQELDEALTATDADAAQPAPVPPTDSARLRQGLDLSQVLQPASEISI